MAAGSDDDDFPLLCDSCLGPNPYIRMMKDPGGGPCKVCERPFTSFHWRPGGKGMRPKKTETCTVCARAKNLCQTCQHDLKYNLPAKVRDQSLAPADRQLSTVPRSDGTREYTANQTVRHIASGAIDAVYKAPPVNDTAERLARNKPMYKRNTAKICTFFLQDRCNRGQYCLYRHEKPDENRDKSLGEQNLRDRYYGTNDPVADKMLAGRKRRLEAPQQSPSMHHKWYDKRPQNADGPSARHTINRPGPPRGPPTDPPYGSARPGEQWGAGSRDRPDTPRGADTERPGTSRGGDMERLGTTRAGGSSFTERPASLHGSRDYERPGIPRSGGSGGDMDRPGTLRGSEDFEQPCTPRGGAVGPGATHGEGGKDRPSTSLDGLGNDRPSTTRGPQDNNRIGWTNRLDGPATGYSNVGPPSPVPTPVPASGSLPPPPLPIDPDIKELYIGGDAIASGNATSVDVHNLFSDCHGLSSVVMKTSFAFALFNSRQAAEDAMRKHHSVRTLKGEKINIKWGKKSKNQIRERDNPYMDYNSRPTKVSRL